MKPCIYLGESIYLPVRVSVVLTLTICDTLSATFAMARQLTYGRKINEYIIKISKMLEPAYNYVHVFRLFGGWASFPFTTSETKLGC